MKAEVLNALLTARTLFNSARKHCFVRDRHIASAGLVVLQDAIELVFYACLIERGIDEVKTIEKLGFDELIGELKHAGIAVPKSGTLKAMNKQRVLVKHHAQLAEPAAVINYYNASLLAVDAVLKEVIGTSLHHVIAADSISDRKVKVHITEASNQIERREYFDAMVSVRKALFLTVEKEYDIAKWADAQENSLSLLLAGYSKAPFYTRNRDWILQHAKDPLAYIQLDHAQVSADMIELGIDPEEFFNVWRLTPAVYELANGAWAVKTEGRIQDAATEENARYCQDAVVAIILAQQFRKRRRRWSEYRRWSAKLLHRQAVLSSAAIDADPLGVVLEEGTVCTALYCVSDFTGQNQFAFIFLVQQDKNKPLIEGYIPLEACQIEVK